VRSSDSVRPTATALVLGVTLAVTGMQFLNPEVLETLRRRPGALAAGEWWRLVSPLFVHSEGWPHLLFNLVWMVPAGIIAERLYGSWRWLLVYFIPGVIGEVAGFAWDPVGAGASLGGSGLLGGLCAWLCVQGGAQPLRIRIWGAAGLAGAIALTYFCDNHGPPILAGACLATMLVQRLPAPTPAG